MPPDPLLPWLFLARVCFNTLALIAIGLALHAGFGVIEREIRRPALNLASGAAVVAAVIGLTRLLFIAAELGDALSRDNLALAWATLAGATLTLGAGALVILLSNLDRFAVLAPVGALAMSASFGLTGHTQGLDNPGLMPVATAMHVLIAGFWIAAPLSLWPRRALADALLANRLRRFSAIAQAAIPILLILGVSLAWTLARGPDGLLHTAYGGLLLLKLAASLVAIVMGAINHQFVARLVTAEPKGGRKWLAATLSVEAAMFVAAILLVSAATTLTGAGEG